MKKNILTTYNFLELSPLAQEKALDEIRYKEADYTAWWENTYTECEKVLSEYGIIKDDIYELNFRITHDENVTVELQRIDYNDINHEEFFKACGVTVPHKTLWDIEENISLAIIDKKLVFHINLDDHQSLGKKDKYIRRWRNEASEIIANTIKEMFKRLVRIANNEYKYITSDAYLRQEAINNIGCNFKEDGTFIPNHMLDQCNCIFY